MESAASFCRNIMRFQYAAIQMVDLPEQELIPERNQTKAPFYSSNPRRFRQLKVIVTS